LRSWYKNFQNFLDIFLVFANSCQITHNKDITNSYTRDRCMDDAKTKPTIEDVARSCGVSISTVSRVINQSSPVSEELTARVRKAMKELSFVPRQMKELPTTTTIVIAVADILNPYYTEIIHGAQEEADRQEFDLLIINVSEHPEIQKQHLNLVTKWAIDGLIVAGTKLSDEDLAELHDQYGLPIVLSRAAEASPFPCIIPDYKTATYQAARYLISLNHRRIAFISGPPDWITAKVRLESFQRALSEAGVPFLPELYQWCSPTLEEATQVANKLLTLPEKSRPTALLAFNDLIAMSVLRVSHTFGLRVPQDLSIIGFDDIAPAAYTIPSLTTLAQPMYRIGQLAVKKLSELLEGKPGGGSILLECPLILRESTGPCPE
jgi:DNA-binding LacI/PurR family transcriptional regulator